MDFGQELGNWMDTDSFVSALSQQVIKLPNELRKKLTWG